MATQTVAEELYTFNHSGTYRTVAVFRLHH